MDLSLFVLSLESLTKEEVCPMYTFKILVRYLAKLYVDIPQAETMEGRLITHFLEMRSCTLMFLCAGDSCHLLNFLS